MKRKYFKIEKLLIVVLLFSYCQGAFSSNRVEVICGPKNSSIENVDITEGMIFESDPNFIPLNVYDIEGNIATVTSWIECEHYIKGGWTFYQDGLKIETLKVSLIQLSLISWAILLPLLIFLFRRTIEKN